MGSRAHTHTRQGKWRHDLVRSTMAPARQHWRRCSRAFGQKCCFFGQRRAANCLPTVFSRRALPVDPAKPAANCDSSTQGGRPPPRQLLYSRPARSSGDNRLWCSWSWPRRRRTPMQHNLKHNLRHTFAQSPPAQTRLPLASSSVSSCDPAPARIGLFCSSSSFLRLLSLRLAGEFAHKVHAGRESRAATIVTRVCGGTFATGRVKIEFKREERDKTIGLKLLSLDSSSSGAE